ncbi:Pfmc-2TM Maurer's cleft two transmembrane, putative [Plasmodium sp. gorilla clade G3]|nr:Pfmc-2TM Maurer's cleft two transmembrane, putative [Plasmodium sp. gorilla clade G3]
MFLQKYIFIIILSATNLFNNNAVEIGTYKLSYNNGGIQFRILAQKITKTQPYGNTLTKVLLNMKNEKGNKAKDNKTKVNKPEDNKAKNNKIKDNKIKDDKTEDNKAKNNKLKGNIKKNNKTKENKIKDNKTKFSITKHIKTKLSKTKDNKTKKNDPQIQSLVNLVDNINITQEKKDTIKTLTLIYIVSDDIVEKNKSINELEKYSNDEECKEHIHNYLIHIRMQNDIKYLKRDNFWNKIGIVTIIALLIILMTGIIATNTLSGLSLYLVIFTPLILMIYLFARFFPETKICFKELKEKYTNFFQKKKKK